MNRVAKFSKVSFDQFYNDYCDTFFEDCDKPSKESVREIYDQIKIPTRATKGSAGYDFFAPFDMSLTPGVEMKVPTGIRVEIDHGWWLACMPKSGLGFKYRLQLNNTVGVIDSDYFHSDNEGHIFAKVINDAGRIKSCLSIRAAALCRAFFFPMGFRMTMRQMECATADLDQPAFQMSLSLALKTK